MLELWLIRHGQTQGNKLQRYIGTTDEDLSWEGAEALVPCSFGEPEAVYVSPMKRCVQTAKILFPEKRLHILEELSECDFGDFENKSYLELSGNADYQAWVDSEGHLPFPGGESREEFQRRCLRGFARAVTGCIRKGVSFGAVVTHGGVIMNLMEAFSQEEGDFYSWHIGNGGGYKVALDQELWRRGQRKFLILEKREGL